MRISTSLIYESGIAHLQQRQATLVKLQEQISTGRRMLTPSDDPVAAAAVLETAQARALNEQMRLNAEAAATQLAQEELALADATLLLQDVKVLAVNAGNAVLRNEDRLALAVEAEGLYAQLLGIANRTDSRGEYLFAGYQGATRPFSESAPGVVAYSGDDGVRLMQIGASRDIALNDSGDAVFRAIRNGNGIFETRAGGNAGSGVVSIGNVTDPSRWADPANSGDFTVRFHVDTGAIPPVTTYDIVDNVNGVSLLTGSAPAAGPHLRAYVPGAVIPLATRVPPDTNPGSFDYGAEIVVTGTPADGDTFAVVASTRQDVFATLYELSALLRTGMTASAASGASYQNRLSSAIANIDNALDNLLSARAGTGVRMREAEAARVVSEDLAVQHEQDLSRLQDLDYAQALSRLSLQQITLEAAQKSFVAVTGLNLFEYL